MLSAQAPARLRRPKLMLELTIVTRERRTLR
jgi:hypothetical protein